MRRLSAAVALAMVLVPLLAPVAARAAEYEMSTMARYVVDPAAGAISVSVEVTFTNTTPDPAGQLSAFDHIELAVQNGASAVSAKDAKGALTVAMLSRDGAQVASVTPRARVRYNRSVSFTLAYRLADSASADVHVRPDVVKFAVWGFGTSSQVTVELPASYQVRADGDPMAIETVGDLLRLTSGPIANPVVWLALVTGSGPIAYATHAASVALASGTVDLQVRAWTDDAAWGERTLAMLVAGLPELEKAIGLPYPRVGPLVVTESIGGEGSIGEPPSPTAEVQVAFDASAFTLLHQAAHIWISQGVAADRWIREGLASHAAERVATSLGEALPYEPAQRAMQLATDASPLVDWDRRPVTAAGDAYGYAASWAFVDLIATSVGEAQLAKAIRRIVAGVSAYDPIDPDALPPTGLRFTAVDTRRFVDQLAAVGGVDLGDVFGQLALGQDAGPELAKRASAREAYDRLLRAAGDWGAPDPIRAAMASWRFDDASAAIVEASAWLQKRDELIDNVRKAGLTTPDRLQARFTVDGGGAQARAELGAERAVVDAYLRLQARAQAPRGPLEVIGLFAADDPRPLLERAGVPFAAGDLEATMQALRTVETQLNRAPTNGAVRIASAAVLLTVIFLLVSLTTRRRGGSHYTAAP